MKKITPRSFVLGMTLLAALAIVAPASAADPAFVGVLATAVEPDVAKHLELSDEVKQKLLELIDQREQEVQPLALNKELPAEERAAKLAEFVAESEKMGLELLTEDQRTKLGQIRIAKLGMLGLADPKIAESIGLSRDEQVEINKIVDQYKSVMATGTASQKSAYKGVYERLLAKKLTPEQKAAWEKLAGPAATLVAQADPPAASGNAPAESGRSSGPVRTSGSNSSGASQKGLPAETGPDGEVLLRFQFSYAPWQDVIDWFAKQADLSFTTADWPKGTFNYTDNRKYTPEQSLDVINSILLTEGYVLVRRERMLKLFNLEDGPVPEPWVPLVKADELDKRGEFELVKVLYQLTKMTPEVAETEINKLKGPTNIGAVIVLSQARQVLVVDTVGKQKLIRAMIAAVEDPAIKDERMEIVRMNTMLPSEFMAQSRTLLGIPELASATPDGSIKIALDDLNMRLIVSGKAAGVERVKELVKLLELDDLPVEPGSAQLPQEQSHLRVYSVTLADPATVLAVLQTLLAQYPDVRVQLDAKSGNIIALARPTQHATITAIIDQLQGKGGTIEVFKLRKLDPAAAVLSINKLFGDPSARDQSNFPKVDADPINMLLSVKGTPSQIAQVRDWLEKMGEIGMNGGALASDRSSTRFLALPGRSAADVLAQAEMLFKTTRGNPIRFITPSLPDETGIPRRDFRRVGEEPAEQAAPPEAPAEEAAPVNPAPPQPRPETKTSLPASRGAFFVAYDGAALPTDATGQPAPAADAPAPAPAAPPADVAPPKAKAAPAAPVAPPETETTPPTETPPTETPPADAPAEGPSTTIKSKSGAEIVITATKNGIIISSEDLDALDEFERLVRTLGEPYIASSGKQPAVFYLKYAKAETAAALLQEMLTGVPTGGDTNDRGLMGDLMGEFGGGMMGALLGLGGGAGGGATAPSGPVTVVPDVRLNALFVTATDRDMEVVTNFLEVIDQPWNPQGTQFTAAPRFIPVLNNSAETVANTVRQVYAGRIQSEGGGQQRQPSPEDFIRALRGGGRGGSSGRGQNRGEEIKMTIGVDTKSNSLIVAAPDYLFEEVKDLVEQLDAVAVPEDQTVRVVTLKRASSDLMQKSLAQRLGTSATIKSATIGGTTTASTTRPTSSSTSSPQSSGQQGADRSREDFDQMRQRMEVFNALRGAGGGGSGFGSPGGFSGRGGFPGGGFQGGFPGGGFQGGGFQGGGRGGFDGGRGGFDGGRGGGDRGGGDRGGGDRGGGDRGRGRD